MTQGIRPAEIRYQEGVPYSAEFGDVYHPAAGAALQSHHVFVAGNGLPARWQGRERFVILETGFGLGNNFLATWDAWRRDEKRCERLHFISIEKHPLSRDDLAAMYEGSALARELVDAWPPLTPNLHRLSFDTDRVQLLLAFGDAAAWLPELVAQVDAFDLDGFAPAKNPQMWQPRLFKAMGRLAAPGATAATWTAARAVREGLTSAGFDVRLADGRGGKRDITLARYAPAFTPRRAPARLASRKPKERRALIVGAGLAGCAAALALAEQGWRSSVIDRHAAPAQEASGNPGGLFHGIVNPQDGAHARFNRAAALQAQHAIGLAIRENGVRGATDGLLRLETSGAGVDTMRASIAAQGLPDGYVRVVDAATASALCGIALSDPAWFYPGGGWVQPVALARAWLERSGAEFGGGVDVATLRRTAQGWQLLDANGGVIDEAEIVVLANAGDAFRLLGQPAWPIEKQRGQISVFQARGVTLPAIPVAGSGYLLPEVDGHGVFGATAQAGDDDPAVRHADHLHNLAQLARLSNSLTGIPADTLQGRTAWRWVTDDRLPIVGRVPDASAARTAKRLDQPRFVPRVDGLFVFSALGSRGITWSTLGARVLASAISGAPAPLEASLLDAIDPARFITREARRQFSSGAGA